MPTATPTPTPIATLRPVDIDDSPAGLSNVALVGLLILAIGALVAVSAWLYAWYQGRQEDGLPPDDGPPDAPPTVGPPDA